MRQSTESLLRLARHLRERYAELVEFSKACGEGRRGVVLRQASGVLDAYFRVEQELVAFHGMNGRGKSIA